MDTFSKSCVSVTAMALCAVAMAQQSQIGPMPIQVPPGALKRVEPSFIQPIMKVGNQIIPLGPRVPYVDRGNSRRVGNLIYDSFEGNSTNGMNPDVPTDGLYGETIFTGTQTGARWYFGDDFCDPYSATHYLSVFPGQANKPALGLDFVMHVNNVTTMDPTPQTVNIVNVFTSGDPFNASSPTPPTNFLTGVSLSYTGGI